jgi:hypothetical protein
MRTRVPALAESVLIGEFEREGKSEIVYLVPDVFSNVVRRMVRAISRMSVSTKLSVTSPPCPAAPGWRPRNCRRLCLAVRREGALPALARNSTAHPRRCCFQGSRLLQRLQLRLRGDVVARGERQRRDRERG